MDALDAGVKKHGPGKWTDIKADPKFSDALQARASVSACPHRTFKSTCSRCADEVFLCRQANLKDKWREKDKWRQVQVNAVMPSAPVSTASYGGANGGSGVSTSGNKRSSSSGKSSSKSSKSSKSSSSSTSSSSTSSSSSSISST